MLTLECTVVCLTRSLMLVGYKRAGYLSRQAFAESIVLWIWRSAPSARFPGDPLRTQRWRLCDEGNVLFFAEQVCVSRNARVDVLQIGLSG